MIDLENEYLKIRITAKGAELQSIFDKTTATERLWSGDPEYWGKKSPVLFPIVGAMKDNTYYFEGKEYHLSRHGFARDKAFNVSFANASEAEFSLNDTWETRDIYPFPFNFMLNYKLNGSTLTCTYKVFNPGDTPLFFSFGAHPAFAVDTAKTEYRNYWLHFNKDENLRTYKITDNLISNEIEQIDLPEGKLQLAHELFYDDALVVKGLQSDCISILNSENRHGLHFRFKSFPYFGIWAARDADFICLEPWCGLADSIDHDQQLQHKEGIISLSPGISWEHSWLAEIF